MRRQKPAPTKAKTSPRRRRYDKAVARRGLHPCRQARRGPTLVGALHSGLAGAEGFFDFGDVGGSVDGDAFIGAFGGADMVAVFEPAKLLELFKALEFAGRERGEFEERGAAKHVQADMLVMARGDAFAGIAHPGN